MENKRINSLEQLCNELRIVLFAQEQRQYWLEQFYIKNIITFNQTTTLSLKANSPHQHNNLHKDVILTNPRNHNFTKVLNKLLIAEEDICPLLGDLGVGHDAKNLQAHLLVLGVNYYHFYQSVFDYTFHP